MDVVLKNSRESIAVCMYLCMYACMYVCMYVSMFFVMTVFQSICEAIGFILGRPGAILCHFGVVLRHFGVMLCAILGASWAILGPTGGQHGPQTAMGESACWFLGSILWSKSNPNLFDFCFFNVFVDQILNDFRTTFWDHFGIQTEPKIGPRGARGPCCQNPTCVSI